jgi:hypothetical protein
MNVCVGITGSQMTQQQIKKLAKAANIAKTSFGRESAITITYSESVENSIGMEQIGRRGSNGLSVGDLEAARLKFEEIGVHCDIVYLRPPGETVCCEPTGSFAAVLVARKAVDAIVGRDDAHVDMLNEQLAYEWDTTVWSSKHGRVVNKQARHNVCYAGFSQTADIANKKGTVIPFSQVPILDKVRQALPTFFGSKANNLLAEGNKYYDASKCGIGYHGDTERAIVIGARLGESIPLHYQWYHRSQPVGSNVSIKLESGDIYAMSEKAVGNDWKRSSILTLRHAAGARKYTDVPGNTVIDGKKEVAVGPT